MQMDKLFFLPIIPHISFCLFVLPPSVPFSFFYSAAKNCSYFKHFTSGEEAEVFEVKTQKGGWIFSNPNRLPQHYTVYVEQ